MTTDTAGTPIYRPISCNCGLTGGCKECMPFNWQTSIEKKEMEENDQISLKEFYRIKRKTL